MKNNNNISTELDREIEIIQEKGRKKHRIKNAILLLLPGIAALIYPTLLSQTTLPENPKLFVSIVMYIGAGAGIIGAVYLLFNANKKK